MIINDFCIPQKKSKIKAGKGLTIGKYKFFTSSNIQSKYINEYDYDKEALIFGTGGTASVHYCNEPFATSTDCIVLYGNKKSYLKIIYLYLSGNLRLLEEGFKGAGLKHISKNYILSSIQINLPSLAEQKQIASVLDKATGLITLRKQQLEKLDLLIKSKFIELFGDPVTNPMGWDTGTIRDIVTEVKYGTSKPAIENGKYIYLRMNNITYTGNLDLSNLKYINVNSNEYEKYVVRKNDILFNRTNSKDLVGKTCVFNESTEMIIAGYLIRIRTNQRALPIYLSKVLNSKYGKDTLFNMCKSIIGQANINAQELQEIKVTIPPLPLQQQFSDFVEHVETLKSTLQKSLALLEIQYKALMQKYFEG